MFPVLSKRQDRSSVTTSVGVTLEETHPQKVKEEKDLHADAVCEKTKKSRIHADAVCEKTKKRHIHADAVRKPRKDAFTHNHYNLHQCIKIRCISVLQQLRNCNTLYSDIFLKSLSQE